MIDVAAIRDRYTPCHRIWTSVAGAPLPPVRRNPSGMAGRRGGAGDPHRAQHDRRGLRELAHGSELPAEQVYCPGGGRKALTQADATLLDNLLTLVSPGERCDPMSPLRWTAKSLRRLAADLQARRHRISHTAVGELLTRQGFRLQADCKTREGQSHPGRDAQFAHIDACAG